jgi:hypothetical protein
VGLDLRTGQIVCVSKPHLPRGQLFLPYEGHAIEQACHGLLDRWAHCAPTVDLRYHVVDGGDPDALDIDHATVQTMLLEDTRLS